MRETLKRILFVCDVPQCGQSWETEQDPDLFLVVDDHTVDLCPLHMAALLCLAYERKPITMKAIKQLAESPGFEFRHYG